MSTPLNELELHVRAMSPVEHPIHIGFYIENNDRVEFAICAIFTMYGNRVEGIAIRLLQETTNSSIKLGFKTGSPVVTIPPTSEDNWTIEILAELEKTTPPAQDFPVPLDNDIYVRPNAKNILRIDPGTRLHVCCGEICRANVIP